MTQDNPTEDIIRREITAARKILREDKIIASHAALSERFDKQFPPKPEAPEGTPPPPEPKDPPADPPKRSSLWWGEQSG